MRKLRTLNVMSKKNWQKSAYSYSASLAAYWQRLSSVRAYAVSYCAYSIKKLKHKLFGGNIIIACNIGA